MGTDNYGETGGEIVAPAFAVFRHSHLRTGSNNVISVSSVSSVSSVFTSVYVGRVHTRQRTRVRRIRQKKRKKRKNIPKRALIFDRIILYFSIGIFFRF